MKSIEQMIEELIVREGGYVNHPADRGGPTNMGVTLEALTEYLGRSASLKELQNLSHRTAVSLYRGKYLSKPQFHRIKDPYLMCLMFDCGVLHGRGRATKWLQEIVGVVADGKFGDKTELAVNTYEPVRLYAKLNIRRIRFIGEITTNDPVLDKAREAGFNLQANFTKGWLNRATEFLEIT